MQDALAKYPALRALTTRDNSDPTIAVLDAFAVMGDVLTFYQERIANEGYLRTATERRSILRDKLPNFWEPKFRTRISGTIT